MYSPIKLLHFFSFIKLLHFFSFLLFLVNPKYMRPLLVSCSETKLFELRSLPDGYLTFLGDSHLRGGEIILTKEGTRTYSPRSTGVVLYNHPILFLDPHSKKVPSFNTMFSFSIQNYWDGEALGDGLTFLISPPDNHLLGKHLGLVDSTDLARNKFIAIEFDTKCDSMFHDPDDNHVGLDINSLFSVKLARASSLGVDLKSGNLISTWIDYKGNKKRLEVFLSYSYLKPKKPLLKVDIDLSNYVKDHMFVGFSAATERSVQLTRIERWEFTIAEFSRPPPPSPPESRTFVKPSESGHRQSHNSSLAIGFAVGVCSIPFVVLFGWFCWKKLMGIIQNSEGQNSLEMQTIWSSGGISCLEIQLSVLVDSVAKGINIEKVLENEAEIIRVKQEKSNYPPCNSLPAVKPSILPLCDSLTPRTNDFTSV